MSSFYLTNVRVPDGCTPAVVSRAVRSVVPEARVTHWPEARIVSVESPRSLPRVLAVHAMPEHSRHQEYQHYRRAS